MNLPPSRMVVVSCRIALSALLTISAARASVVLQDSNLVDAEVVAPTTLLGQITRIAWAPDSSGRIFATLKTGQVMIAINGSVLATPFTTFSPIATAQEGGLLGMAFDPAFLVNHYVYFMYQPTASVQTIVRMDASGNVGVNPTTIIDNLPSNNGERDDESLAVGPDGNLYFSIGNLGDGSANGGAGLDLLYLSSKVSRIHMDGTPVPSNPFYTGSGLNNDFIFARGFTSPFMTLFQPASGTLMVCDVGDFYEQFFLVTAGIYAGGNTNENRQTAGMLSPIIAYHKLGLGEDTIAVASASRSGDVVTLTTSTPHWQHAGGQIALSGMPDPSYNGTTLIIQSVPSPTSLTVAQPGPDLAEEPAGNGLITVTSFGNCTTGAVFWDSSSVPAPYRGNLIYGDYISGNMVRVTFDATNAVSGIRLLATGSASHVAMAQGPDGALYYAGYTNQGTIRRLSYAASSPAIAAPLHLNLMQGAPGMIPVCLTAKPTSAVTVTAAMSGDPSLSLTSGQTLTFTPANYSIPQTVMVAGSASATASAAGTVTLTGTSGTGSASVAVNAAYIPQGISLSTNALTVSQGASATFTVQLAIAPTSPVTVALANTHGSPQITATPGTLTFTSANYSTPQTVTVNAAIDPGQVNDSATISAQATGLATSSVAVTSTAPAAPGAPTLILSTQTLSVAQGGDATFTVQLSAAPSSTAVVTLANTQGSGLISAAPAALTFTSADYSTAQTVTVSAAADPGQADDSATITASAPGIAPSSVAITSTPTTVPAATTSNSSGHHCGNGSYAGMFLFILLLLSIKRRLVS
jgi:glucose/arabinose dehydrogenase